MAEPLIDLRGIRKVFRSPFLRRPKVALQDLDLQVRPGEIFGFLGPNGAGKTTSIKILLGLIRPSAGTGTMLGRPFGSVEARRQVGFLPDAPNFYRYLTGRELLAFGGQLHGLGGADLRDRVERGLDRVHLADEARDRQLRTYSRGMLQRVGIAAAILHDPRLVILDEPMNGLDPQGRSQFRDLIRSLRDAGTTVFLSTHVLGDIETTADRVAILNRGELVRGGSLDEFLATDGRVMEMEFQVDVEGARLRGDFRGLRRVPAGWLGELERQDVERVVRRILDQEGTIVRLAPRRVSLEEYFLKEVAGDARAASSASVSGPERAPGRPSESGGRVGSPAESARGKSW
ncbi:MAG TPA: ABC transporter ATP-binding protein [bacterium]|nr:ABC transporter ATP-binding protein [bacterium]